MSRIASRRVFALAKGVESEGEVTARDFVARMENI